MKRMIALISVFIFVISLNVSFADTTLTVTKINPKDGEKNILPASFMMKVTFSEDINVEGNEEYFKLIDEKGKSVEINVIQGTNPDRLDITPKDYLNSGQKYILEIEPSVKAVSGNVLAEKYTSDFSTSKMKKNVDLKTIALLFGILAASGVIIQKSKSILDKSSKKRKEEREREEKKLERREKKEKQRQKYEDKDDKQ